MASDDAGARGELVRLFRAALARVEGAAAVRDWLAANPLGEGDWHVVAIGKAAASMALGAEQALGSRLRAGLMITKEGHAEQGLHDPQRWAVRQAEHPVPGAGSLAAGKALLSFIEGLPASGRVLFLLSGGASSLAEVLPRGFDLEDLRRASAWLLGSGLDIADINRVRQRLSLIKGGRLRGYLGRRQACVLAISDVAGDDVRAIGSGPLAEPLPGDLPELPGWLAEWTERAAPQREYASAVPHHVIAGIDDALQAAADAAARAGFEVHQQGACLYGDTAQTGARLGKQLREATAGVWLWGGETTIHLPENPGRGGRNQHLALAAAMELAGVTGVSLLAAGTDGTDGPTEDAGAIVDGGTLERGLTEGLDAAATLAGADAGRFLEASGDLLSTGPTGTNVTDLVIGLKWREA
jgi:hydroxypyruvate reductase